MAYDITESIPFDIGGGSSGTGVADRSQWDVLIGGLGFNLRPTAANPYQRATEQTRKQQIDTSDEAGEQSLSNWWTRSQDAWHYGAGIRWYEPGAENVTSNRFSNSQGVDPWTIGDLSLLHRMYSVDTQANDIYVCSMSTGGVDGYISTYADTIEWVPSTGTGSSDTLSAAGVTQPTASGGVAWVGFNGGVAKFDTSTGTATEPWTCTGVARAWWVKARLIVAIGATLYEIAPGSSGVVESAGTELLTHPNSDWTWTDVSETAGAIIAAGYADNDSAVFRFTAQNNATTGDPELVGGSQVLKMPPGESISAMGVYLGTYCVIATTAGVRISIAADDGAISLGRLSVSTDTAATDVTFRDRFAYLSLSNAQPDGSSGVLRIDVATSVIDDNGNSTDLYAWAWDVSTGDTGTTTSLALIGSRVVLASDQQVWLESATDYVESGWLETGRIRFRTVEEKAFRYAKIVSDLNNGGVELTTLTPDGNEYRVVAFGPTYVVSSNVAIQIPGASTHQYLSFRVTLTPDSAATASPVVSGLVIKAQPAADKIRLYSYPLAMFDEEKGRHGGRRGRRNQAYERLVTLEALDESGAPVSIRDNRTGEAYTGQIDSVAFSAESPPDGAASGFGGVATVVVRRL